MSKFFINRPIFAAVIALIIVLSGIIAMKALPIAQYPELAPPNIAVTAAYPGANSQVIADTVATPIEKQVNGVEGMIYMKSTSTNAGTYTLNVTFAPGTDADMASVFVQNRVATATAGLPAEVKQTGVTTKKKSTSIVQMIILTSPNGEYDKFFLSNYITLRLKDEISRLPGVGDVSVFGAGDYAMRLWLDPGKLKSRGLTTGDVARALQAQNVQVAAGKIGAAPAPDYVAFEYTINTLGRLTDIDEFEKIILKRSDGGRFTRLKDVARLELASQDYSANIYLNNQQAAGMMIYQLPGANALELAAAVKAKMEELHQAFPPGLEYQIPFDTTLFIQDSIDEVVTTLIIAVLLVFITIYVFLQDWRATLIPGIAIPVSLIGTFGLMLLMGFSINMITLFGLVLAIGIVVDDAIVVVENTARNIDDFGMNSKDAAIKAMEEVAGPVVATTLVLMAVFVPTAFLGGITGQIYRQFALTISAATLISSINALTMSPALCALLLRPSSTKKNFFFRKFDAGFDISTRWYVRLVKGGLRKSFFMVLIFAALSAAALFGFTKLPGGFIPTEDQGYAMYAVQLPDGAAMSRTDKVTEAISNKVGKIDGIADVIRVPGFSMLDSAMASNSAAFWVIFDSFAERMPKGQTMDVILAQMGAIAAQTQEAIVMPFPPPPIMGLGNTGGFSLQLEDRAGVGLNTLGEVTTDFFMNASQDPRIAQAFSTFRANVPQLYAEVNRTKVEDLDISLSEVFAALQAYLGSSYVNDFNKFNRTFQVRIQADADFRSQIRDIGAIEVRSNKGKMVPLATFVEIRPDFGPMVVNRFNMYPAATISGSGAPGVSSGQTLDVMEGFAANFLPSSMGTDWSDMSFQEKTARNPLPIFAMCIVFTYLVLCAQYESWSTSLCVMMTATLGLCGTVAAVMIRAMDNNVYTQIGIVLLIALACKNAILIIEFAVELRKEGKSLFEAATEAARLRFRPVMMTAFSFILGTFPLVIAAGAGAASRQALGTAVFYGMIAATFLGVIFVPIFYLVIAGFSERYFGVTDE